MSTPDPDRSSGFFDSAYRDAAPWDIGQAQPAMLALFEEYPPAGSVLDVGCGTGDLALALVGRGLAVLGIDLAASAIAQAQAKAAGLTPETSRLAEFRVGDALHPAQFPGPFGAIVDSGFFHLFGPLEREHFVHELTAALVSGGRYYLLGFAVDSPIPNAPREVREDELRTLFSPERGWRMLVLRPARFVTRSTRGDVPAIAACFERMSSAQQDDNIRK